MPRSMMTRLAVATAVFLASAMTRAADDPKKDEKKPEGKAAPVSFIKEVAPILVQSCIACHNLKKSESKYIMTNFAQLAKGGQQGEGITLEPGDPDASRFVELIRADGAPRMPYKQDPLSPQKIAVIERWVSEGAKYDGGTPTEDWVGVLRKALPVRVPESYPATVPITALAFSPDGTDLASSGFHEVNLWKTADGALDRRLKGQAERIYEIAYSRDGKWMAIASGDPGQFGSVCLLTAEPSGGGKAVRELLETTDSVFAVAFSPDSKKLAAAGADRAIRVWDVESGKLLATIEDHADWILDVAFSPDGKKLASASRDKTAKVFDVEKKESQVTFPGHAQTVNAVAFTSDGKQVLSAGDDNTIRYWSVADEAKQARQIGGFGGPVFKIELAPDGKTFAACSSDKTVKVYETATGTKKQSLEGHADWVYAIAFAPDGKSLASGSWDGQVRLWNLADGKPIKTLIAAPGYKAPAGAQASAK